MKSVRNCKLSMPESIYVDSDYIETAGSLLEPLFLTYDIERIIGVVANNNYMPTPKYISEPELHRFMQHIGTHNAFVFRCDIIAAVNQHRLIAASEINMITSHYGRESVAALRRAAAASVAELNTDHNEIDSLFAQLSL